MKEHIQKLVKCLKDHQRAYDDFPKAHQAMRSTLDDVVKGIKSESLAPTVTGYMGSVQKGVTTHDSVAQAFGKSHELFHDGMRNAIDGLSTSLGITPDRI